MASLFEEVEHVFDVCTISSLKRQELRLRWEAIIKLYGRTFEPDTTRLMNLVIDAQEECKPVVDAVLKNWSIQLARHIQETKGYTSSEQYGIPTTEIFASLLVDHGLYNPKMLSNEVAPIPTSNAFEP